MVPDCVVSRKKLENAIDNAVTITGRNFIKFQDIIPDLYTINGIYPYHYGLAGQNSTQKSFRGFWPGIIWLMYELLRKDHLKCYAQKQTQQISDSIIQKNMNLSNHGFFIIPSCVPDIRTSQSNIAKKAVIAAADSLINKYIPSAKVICSDEVELNRDTLCAMISNLVNNRVLDFAYELTNDEKYLKIAENDTKTIAESNIKPDGLVYFRRYFDRKSGQRLSNRGVLTYHPDSGSKTRSYAWAMLGLAVNYSHTHNNLYLQKFDTVFEFLIKHKDCHNFINARVNDIEFNTPDSTSSAIIAAALTEILKSDTTQNKKYFDVLSEIMNMLIDEYSINPDSHSEGLLSGGFMEKMHQRNPSVIIGDYFYFETLLNLYTNRQSFWYSHSKTENDL